MKIKTFILCLLLILTLSLPVSAAEKSGIEVKLDEKYTVLNGENLYDNSEFLEKIGYTVSSMNNFLSNNGVVAFVSADGNTFQMQIQEKTTDFSGEIGDISKLDDNGIRTVANEIVPSGAGIAAVGKIKYITSSSKNRSDDGEYQSLQYTTFCNGIMYVVTFYVAGSSVGERQRVMIDECLSGINYHRKDVGTSGNVFPIILISVIILALACVIFFTVTNWIKDKKSGDIGEETIKRRKL